MIILLNLLLHVLKVNKVDINFCKYKCNNCEFHDVFKNQEDNQWYLRIIQQMWYHDIPIEQPSDKIQKQFFKFDQCYIYVCSMENAVDFFRNIKMKSNTFCPYFFEHEMSDIRHEEKLKNWFIRQKKKKKLIKKFANARKNIIL